MSFYTNQELCNAVYAAVFQSEKPVSRLEICTAIGRKKSPHILKMIEHLVETGWIEKSWSETKLGRPVLVYKMPDKNPAGLPCQIS